MLEPKFDFSLIYAHCSLNLGRNLSQIKEEQHTRCIGFNMNFQYVCLNQSIQSFGIFVFRHLLACDFHVYNHEIATKDVNITIAKHMFSFLWFELLKPIHTAHVNGR